MNSTEIVNEHERSENAIDEAKYFYEKEGDVRKAMTGLIDFIDIELNPGEQTRDWNPEIIGLLIKIMLPPSENDEELSDEEYKLRVDRLRTFMEVINSDELINIDKPFDGKIRFRKIVNYCRYCIHELTYGQNPPFYDDISNKISYRIPKSHLEIDLGLQADAHFNNVIGPSKCTKQFYSDHLIQLLRMMSILFELNQYWRSLFGLPTFELILNRNDFFCAYEIDDWQDQAKIIYSFLFHSTQRIVLNYTEITKTLECFEERIDDAKTFTISRGRVLQAMVEILTKKVILPGPYWNYIFKDEYGEGEGVNNEFYTLVSRDLQKYDLHLFNGEPITSSDGVQYVTSSCGLFPSPCLQLDEKSKNILITFGKLMAKANIDMHVLDLRFSKAFYKYLIYGKNKAQCLNLNDIEDVMPSIVSFVNKLVIIMNEVNRIDNDIHMTPEEKSEEMSKLTYDGSPLEELYFDFTIPGYPDMEMIPGGRDKLLKVDNVEEYLQLLVWWLLYKGPQEKLDSIRYGYEMFMTDNYDKLLIDDLDEILSGEPFKSWTQEELEKNFELEDDMTMDTPVIKFLLEVLASFEVEDQRDFLKFVTGTPNWLFGGISDEISKLIIRKEVDNHNNDFYLPSATTCHRTLTIPEYSSQDILKQKLLMAIREGCGSFDYK